MDGSCSGAFLLAHNGSPVRKERIPAEYPGYEILEGGHHKLLGLLYELVYAEAWLHVLDFEDLLPLIHSYSCDMRYLR